MRSITYPHILKQFGLSVVIALVAVGFSVVQADTVSFKAARDCNADAIISCGSLSSGELLNAYDGSTVAQQVYGYFGINRQDINDLPLTARAGHVDKDGNVYINGKSAPVATNGITAGRRNSDGGAKVTTAGVTFYQRPLSGSLDNQSTDAFVIMDGNSFKFAILAAGDYPVVGRPKTVAKPPAPKPTTTTPATPTTPANPDTPAAPTPAIPGTMVNTGPLDAADLALFATVIATSTLAAYRYQLRKVRK